ncbi:MAG: 6-phosphogluconolactonase [Ilumatobacteraceae bacterium]
MASRTIPDVFVLAAESIGELIKDVISASGICSIVVSGGLAMRHTLGHLAVKTIPWSSVHLYMADERCIQRSNRDRNDAMVSEVLIRPAQIKPEHFNQIPAELGPLEGAESYSRTISAIKQFDIALLGVGADGHIASLFPNHPSVESCERVVAVENSPKFPPNRVSLGLTMLRGATHRIVVVAGVEKSDLIARILEGQRPPVALVEPTGWFLDSQIVGFRVDGSMITQQGQTT